MEGNLRSRRVRGRETRAQHEARAQPRVLVKESWIAGIGDLGVDDLSEGGKFVGFRVVRANDIENFPVFSNELVGDEAAVAAPWERLGAHDRGAVGFGEYF